MRDNPFANRETVHINLTGRDDILEDGDSFLEEECSFEDSLLFMYRNEESGTFAQFEMEDVSSDCEPLEAIEIFMQRVLEFGKVGAKPLPSEFLETLTDAELNLFMLAHIENHYYENIREMIYIQKENDYYQDRYGFTYYVAAVGVKEAVLWFEQNEKLLTLHTTPEQLQHPGDKLYVMRDNSAEYRVNVENFYEE